MDVNFYITELFVALVIAIIIWIIIRGKIARNEEEKIKASKEPATRTTKTNEANLKGLEGWLYLVGIFIVYILIRGIYDFVDMYSAFLFEAGIREGLLRKAESPKITYFIGMFLANISILLALLILYFCSLQKKHYSQKFLLVV